ncbi:putative membrane protein [Symbiobacterium terraclitae]|uniref:Membrane protein n=1 Tax=Symbiobacterium terraclitae TaxID=557451 RepID=A0ABS4JVU4_9FIRM|nr:DUF1634 domain-containing protein [Symbiobacterium terraclitae]MBP2019629.1 putative membrane protein [Symbiobacterium terraclitae]
MDTTRTQEPSVSREVEQVELAVSRLLRLGTGASAALIAAGLLLLLFATSAGIGPALVTAGLITLVCTPLLRVTAAMVIYLKLGDRTYALICLSVLLFVFIGFLLGETH